MIIPVAALILVLVPAGLGGRVTRLAGVRLRAVGLLVSCLAAQVVILELLTGPEEILAAVHAVTYVGTGWFLWRNRRVPGLLLVAAGACSNGVTILANGGVLPASPGALAAAGLGDTDGFTNSGVLDQPRLWFLGDVFAIPAGWPLANVFSVGDVLILLGACYASTRICGTRWSAPWSPGSAGHGMPRHRKGIPPALRDAAGTGPGAPDDRGGTRTGGLQVGA